METKDTSGKKNVSDEAVINELKDIAFSEDIKVSEKMRALELLGKHLGLFDPAAREAEIRVIHHIPRPNAKKGKAKS